MSLLLRPCTVWLWPTLLSNLILQRSPSCSDIKLSHLSTNQACFNLRTFVHSLIPCWNTCVRLHTHTLTHEYLRSGPNPPPPGSSPGLQDSKVKTSHSAQIISCLEIIFILLFTIYMYVILSLQETVNPLRAGAVFYTEFLCMACRFWPRTRYLIGKSIFPPSWGEVITFFLK